MPFTNNYTQDGFNKKNLQTVLHVPFVVVAIYYEKMHKLIIIKHQGNTCLFPRLIFCEI